MTIGPARFRNGHGDNAVLDGFLALADEWIARAADAPALPGSAMPSTRWCTPPTNARSAPQLSSRRAGSAAPISYSHPLRQRAPTTCARASIRDWSIDQLARVALMAASHDGDDVAFAARFDAFCATAEVNELIALCRGLPIYPGANLLEPRAREAVRSGIIRFHGSSAKTSRG
jgi:hypothetical protein